MFNAKQTRKELVAWIKGYFKNNGSEDTKAVIGISGGKDSSVVAALCVEALGKDRVFGVLMPQGEQFDIDVSYALCRHLDIAYRVINVGAAVKNVMDGIEEAGLALTTVTTYNTPARIRMTVLYAVSGSIGGRVANTSNLSEDWVGYATKFGDAAGDFSPLSKLTVTEIKAIGRELDLPAMFIDKVPIDGLCGQSDEENLGFTYDTLDKYIRNGIIPEPEVKAKIDKLHAMNLHKINPMPAYDIN